MKARRDAEHRPVSVTALALGLPESSWQIIPWREGIAGPLASRFARLRVHAAHRDYSSAEPRDEEWLLIEWPESETESTKYWPPNPPEAIPFNRLVNLDRAHQELKQELIMRAGLARPPPSRNAVHRGLCVFDRRAGEDSSLASGAEPQFPMLGIPTG